MENGTDTKLICGVKIEVVALLKPIFMVKMQFGKRAFFVFYQKKILISYKTAKIQNYGWCKTEIEYLLYMYRFVAGGLKKWYL